MTKEDKKLLLKDLCARLPYGVKIQRDWVAPMTGSPESKIDDFSTFDIESLSSLIEGDIAYVICDDGKYHEVRNYFCKPFLRPLSSMTNEEKEELKSEFCIDIREEDNGRHTERYGYVTVYHNFNDETWYIPYEAIDWLNEHHFDYRGLIDKGLAIELK